MPKKGIIQHWDGHWVASVVFKFKIELLPGDLAQLRLLQVPSATKEDQAAFKAEFELSQALVIHVGDVHELVLIPMPEQQGAQSFRSTLGSTLIEHMWLKTWHGLRV